MYMSAYLRGFTYLLLLSPGQTAYQVATQACLIKSIHRNSLAHHEHLGSIDPGCLADRNDHPIAMTDSTATRSGPQHLPATSRPTAKSISTSACGCSKSYMCLMTWPTRKRYRGAVNQASLSKIESRSTLSVEEPTTSEPLLILLRRIVYSPSKPDCYSLSKSHPLTFKAADRLLSGRLPPSQQKMKSNSYQDSTMNQEKSSSLEVVMLGGTAVSIVQTQRSKSNNQWKPTPNLPERMEETIEDIFKRLLPHGKPVCTTFLQESETDNDLTRIIDLASIRDTTHTNNVARIVSHTTTRSQGLAKDPDTDVARPKEITLARATLSSPSLSLLSLLLSDPATEISACSLLIKTCKQLLQAKSRWGSAQLQEGRTLRTNRDHSSNFAIPCKEAAHLTRTVIHTLTLPNTPAKRGKLTTVTGRATDTPSKRGKLTRVSSRVLPALLLYREGKSTNYFLHKNTSPPSHSGHSEGNSLVAGQFLVPLASSQA